MISMATGRLRITFKLNGDTVSTEVHPLGRLIDLIREDCGGYDVKEGCGEGECGACTILLNGKPVASCLLNAIHADGAEILTADGAADTPLGQILVDCFDEVNAVQCGFCFPGIFIASYHHLMTGGDASLGAIKQSLSGNICRCTGYQMIFEAVRLACRRQSDSTEPADE